MLASRLIATSAIILFALGCVHLLYTFNGPKLHPRDPALIEAMKADHPRITRETTVWDAALGFHASHSMGAMLFGLIYAYLALFQPTVLWNSPFLTTLGLVTLGSYLLIAWLYWFRIPMTGIALATLAYGAGCLVHVFSTGAS